MTQLPDHWVLQQYESFAQTFAVHSLHDGFSGSPDVQTSCVHPEQAPVTPWQS